jgi:hypothetical protein
MWKKTVVAYYKALIRQLPGETEENHEDVSYDSRSPGLDLNPGPSQHKAEVSELVVRIVDMRSAHKNLDLKSEGNCQFGCLDVDVMAEEI